MKQDWDQNPSLLILEVLGTATSMVAAILLSFEITGLIPVYLCWIVGSMCLSWSSWRRRNMNMLMLMAFYTVLNLVGIYTYS